MLGPRSPARIWDRSAAAPRRLARGATQGAENPNLRKRLGQRAPCSRQSRSGPDKRAFAADEMRRDLLAEMPWMRQVIEHNLREQCAGPRRGVMGCGSGRTLRRAAIGRQERNQAGACAVEQCAPRSLIDIGSGSDMFRLAGSTPALGAGHAGAGVETILAHAWRPGGLCGRGSTRPP